MNSNLGENLTLEKLARHAGLHPTYLSALFHQCIGTSPIAYLNARRVILALDELSRDKLRIGEIAEKLGFRNLAAFSRFFHDRVRISPSEYRREHLKKPLGDNQNASAGAAKSGS
ncbi:MAG: helix-turn-helix transcriptional regulator [Lentisphaeria bacterium]|nr:helix-turn-helix transcriptional regulator [Lentisphaeria bacterium]